MVVSYTADLIKRIEVGNIQGEYNREKGISYRYRRSAGSRTCR
jgi:hypothetical protein